MVEIYDVEFLQPPLLYLFLGYPLPLSADFICNCPQDKLDNKLAEISSLQRNLSYLEGKVSGTMPGMAQTLVEFVMSSLGFCVLGIVVACVGTVAFKRFAPSCASGDDDVDVNIIVTDGNVS